MNRGYFRWVILLAAICLLMVPIFMWTKRKSETQAPFPIEQAIPTPQSPFKFYISAVGVVEASSGNISIGSPMNRLVDKVNVVVGQKVKKGDELFRLEANDLLADLEVRRLEYENALASLKKLEALPRQEDVASAKALLDRAKAELEQAKSQFQNVEGLQLSGAMSTEEVARRKYAYEQAEANYQQAEASFNKTKAGAWEPNLQIARLKVKQAKAMAERIKSDLERTIIRAPIDATVLQIKIHPGEFPPSDSNLSPPMILGNTDLLYLRVGINQFDASFFDSKSPAIAFLQGNAQIQFPLNFVRIEPFFVAKQIVSNDISEKIDTRVLQVIYSFKEGENRVFVGQQMDVFIETTFEAIGFLEKLQSNLPRYLE